MRALRLFVGSVVGGNYINSFNRRPRWGAMARDLDYIRRGAADSGLGPIVVDPLQQIKHAAPLLGDNCHGLSHNFDWHRLYRNTEVGNS